MIEFQNRQIKLPDGSPVVVCRIKGSIDGITLEEFETKLMGFLEQGVKHLIIVFSQVHYINSTGMGVLVKLADKFQEVEGEFNLVDVPDKMVALFNMLGLLALIKLSKTEEDALKSFQEKITLAKRKNLASKPGVATSPSEVKQAAPFAARQAATHTATAAGNAAVRNAIANVKQNTPDASVQKTVSPRETQPTSLPPAKEKRVYVVGCKKCGRKISLGSALKEGTYKCPCCMTMFKVLAAGKIEYLKS